VTTEGEATSRPPRFPITQLLLVRCGELEDRSFLPDFTGHVDPNLSPRGRQQADAIGRRLGQHEGPPVMALYASPLMAAQTTAYIVGTWLGLPDEETSNALATVMPEQLPEGQAGLDAFAAIQERIWEFVEVLRQMHPPDVSLVLVTHELPIRALIARALSIPLEEAHRFAIDEASVSMIEFRGPRTLLATLNDVCHAEDEATDTASP
jgi:broad specificity phosphatase PhoE